MQANATIENVHFVTQKQRWSFAKGLFLYVRTFTVLAFIIPSPPSFQQSRYYGLVFAMWALERCYFGDVLTDMPLTEQMQLVSTRPWDGFILNPSKTFRASSNFTASSNPQSDRPPLTFSRQYN